MMENRTERWLALLTLLGVADTALLAWLSLRQPPQPPSGPPGGAVGLEMAPSPPPPRGADEAGLLGAYLGHALAHLQTRAQEEGVELSGALPAGDELLAALSSGRFQGEEARRVLAAIRSAYELLGEDPPPLAPSPEGGERGVGPRSPGAAPGAGGGPAPAAAVAVYLELLRRQLEHALRERGQDPGDWLPDDQAFQRALEAESLDDPAVEAVLARFRRAYAELGLAFPEAVAGAAGSPDGTAGSSDGEAGTP